MGERQLNRTRTLLRLLISSEAIVEQSGSHCDGRRRAPLAHIPRAHRVRRSASDEGVSYRFSKEADAADDGPEDAGKPCRSSCLILSCVTATQPKPKIRTPAASKRLRIGFPTKAVSRATRANRLSMNERRANVRRHVITPKTAAKNRSTQPPAMNGVGDMTLHSNR